MPFCNKCGKEIEENSVFCPECEQEYIREQQRIQEVEAERKNKGPRIFSILTSIIYPLIAVVLALLFAKSPIGLALSVVSAIAAGILCYLSGFYLIVIPLYFFNLFKFGCARTNLEKGKKVFYTIFAVVFLVLSFVIPYIL